MKSLESLSKDPRVTIRRKGQPDPEGRCVVYWMRRSQRANDNLALNSAILLGNLLQKPVVVYLHLIPHATNANLRHYNFLVQGLGEIAEGLKRRRVGFVLRRYPDPGIVKFCDEVRPCILIGDENPLRGAEAWKEKIAHSLRVPFWTVDADVIVPSKLLGKEHYAARTIRPRIHSELKRYLVPIKNIPAKFHWEAPRALTSLDPNGDLLSGLPIDRSVEPVETFRGGPREANRILKRFIRTRLQGYAESRNHPEREGTSQLSAYLHFGHTGPHSIALAVQKAKAPRNDKAAFLEEMIVRRELAINFVRFNPFYDSLQSSEPWALRTLHFHSRDSRHYLYSEKQLEFAETHDPLWNAAEKQMLLTGWMHGYLRMYWAKKILEWTPSPEVAFEIAVRLNDRYELDGRDPNGYTGIAWAIGGKHDRAWGPERTVFGKIRYMSLESTSRKFDSQAYIRQIQLLEK